MRSACARRSQPAFKINRKRSSMKTFPRNEVFIENVGDAVERVGTIGLEVKVVRGENEGSVRSENAPRIYVSRKVEVAPTTLSMQIMMLCFSRSPSKVEIGFGYSTSGMIIEEENASQEKR